MLSDRHPEARAQRASKDARPGRWPSILRDARSALLGMTEKALSSVGGKLSLITYGVTSCLSALALESERRLTAA